MNRLKEQYINDVIPALQKKFEYKNVMEIPKLEKVVVNVGCGDGRDNPKIIEATVGDIEKITGQHPEIRQVHGFYVEESTQAVSFDILLDYAVRDPAQITDAIRAALKTRFPDYDFYINIDRDFSE